MAAGLCDEVFCVQTMLPMLLLIAALGLVCRPLISQTDHKMHFDTRVLSCLLSFHDLLGWF
jgi:hypothetical protein